MGAQLLPIIAVLLFLLLCLMANRRGIIHRSSALKAVLTASVLSVVWGYGAQLVDMIPSDVFEEEIPPIQEVPSLDTCGLTRADFSLDSDAYTLHRKAAKELEDSIYFKDFKSLKSAKASGALVEVIDGDGFKVNHKLLKHSHAYLRQDAFDILQAIGSDFKKRIADTEEQESVFVISSLTRTGLQQQALRKKNQNATKSSSAHNFGAAFDIYNVKTIGGSCDKARSILGGVLADFRKRGWIMLLPESGCIHVTVR
jgi:hypothetical protein